MLNLAFLLLPSTYHI